MYEKKGIFIILSILVISLFLPSLSTMLKVYKRLMTMGDEGNKGFGKILKKNKLLH